MQPRARSLIALVAALAVAGAIAGGVVWLRGGGPAGIAGSPKGPSHTALASRAAPSSPPADDAPPRVYDEEDIATWMHGAPLGGVGPRHDPKSVWAAMDVPWEPWEDQAEFDAMWAHEAASTPKRARGRGGAVLGDEDDDLPMAANLVVHFRHADGSPPRPTESARLEVTFLRPRGGDAANPGAGRGRVVHGQPDDAGALRIAIPEAYFVEGPIVLTGEMNPASRSIDRWTATPLIPARCALRPGENGPVTLTAAPPVDLDVEVLDSAGVPASGRLVVVGTQSDALRATTDARGRAHFAALSSHLWDDAVGVEDDMGAVLASAPVAIDGANATRRLQLPPPNEMGELEVVMVDESGAPLPLDIHALVLSRGAGGDLEILSPWSEAPQPSAAVPLPVGRYHLSTWEGGRGARVFTPVDLRVRKGERTVATLTPRPAGRIRLRSVLEGAGDGAFVRTSGDVEGAFELRRDEVRLVRAQGWVELALLGSESQSVLHEARLHVAPGETVDLSLVSPACGALEVHVRGSAGALQQSVAPRFATRRRVEVGALRARYDPFELVKRDGGGEVWRAAGIPSGPCEVSCMGATKVVDVIEGETTQVELPVSVGRADDGSASAPEETSRSAFGHVGVSVVDGDRAAPLASEVIFRRAVDGMVECRRSTSGGAAIAELPVGGYFVTARGSARVEGAAVRVEVVADLVTEVVVPLGDRATAWIDGRVTTAEEGGPSKRWAVTAREAEGGAEIRRTESTLDGRFSLGPLPGGVALRLDVEEAATRIPRPSGERILSLVGEERRPLEIELAPTARIVVRGEDLYEAWVIRPGASGLGGRLAPASGDHGGALEGLVEAGPAVVLVSFRDRTSELYRYTARLDAVAGETVEVTAAPARGRSTLIMTIDGPADMERGAVRLDGPNVHWRSWRISPEASAMALDLLPAGRYTLRTSAGRTLRAFDLAEGAAIDLGTVRLGP